jgi:hypothetical protein
MIFMNKFITSKLKYTVLQKEAEGQALQFTGIAILDLTG